MSQEVIYLVGDFSPAVLERWTEWAQRTNRIIKVSSFEELDSLEHTNPCFILDEHGLNDLHLPGFPPCSSSSTTST